MLTGGISNRTFDLFKRTGIDDILIPYKLSGVNTPQLFNQILYVSPDLAGPDVFKVSKFNGGVVPNEYALPCFLVLSLMIYKCFDIMFNLLPYFTETCLRGRTAYLSERLDHS